MEKFSLKKARKFQRKFGDEPQKILGHKKKMWVLMRDYDELDRWFREALSHIQKLEKELKKKSKKPSRK